MRIYHVQCIYIQLVQCTRLSLLQKKKKRNQYNTYGYILEYPKDDTHKGLYIRTGYMLIGYIIILYIIYYIDMF